MVDKSMAAFNDLDNKIKGWMDTFLSFKGHSDGEIYSEKKSFQQTSRIKVSIMNLDQIFRHFIPREQPEHHLGFEKKERQ